MDCNNNPSQSTPSPRFTLRKGEKLRHRTLVEALFKEGKSIYDFPLRLTWRMIDNERLTESFRDHVPERIDSVQMLVTVPKKKRRHAVDRVLLRRRIREAYRLNRIPLLQRIDQEKNPGTLSLAFVYIDTRNASYAEIEEKMKNLLRKLISRLPQQTNKTVPKKNHA